MSDTPILPATPARGRGTPTRPVRLISLTPSSQTFCNLRFDIFRRESGPGTRGTTQVGTDHVVAVVAILATSLRIRIR